MWTKAPPHNRRKHRKRCGPIYHYLEANGPDAITRKLNAGMSQTALAKEIGLSRQGLSDWVERNVPLWQRRRACAYCGKLLDPKRAWSATYHPECVYPADLAQRRANGELVQGRPRKRLWPFQEIALAEYQRRGYTVEWAPYLAQYTFIVNGLRVAVKGSTFGENAEIYHWCLRPWRTPDRLSYDNLPERCDLFHCIGEHLGKRVHLILTAEEAGTRYAINLRPPEYCTRSKPRNLKYADRWGLFETGEKV